MTGPLYKDEAIIRSVTYSTRGGHKVTFEMDPDGWERLKGMEATRCAMVLVAIQNDGAADPDPKPFKPEKPKRRMSELSRAQQAGILCNDPQFHKFIDTKVGRALDDDTLDAAGAVRFWCDVSSRIELNDNIEAAALWDALRTEYDAWRGVIAGPDA